MKKEIKIASRKSASIELEALCILSNINSGDFIEVTKWANGEAGWDVTINASGREQMFHITRGQLKALKKLVKSLK